MFDNEIEKRNDNTTDVVSGEDVDIVTLVNTKWSELKDLDTKIKESEKRANDAKEKSNEAKNKSAGFGHKKAAIESLQDATVSLADSQAEIVEAQRLTFDYQKRLSIICEKLLYIGVNNIATTRTVIRELKLKLEGASEEELSELAKQEMLNVISQLKAQEDMMNKQERISKAVKSHDMKIKAYQDKTDQHEIIISEIKQKEKEQDKRLSEQAEKDVEHDILLSERKQKVFDQDKQIKAQKEKDIEHDKKLAEGEKKTKSRICVFPGMIKKSVNMIGS